MIALAAHPLGVRCVFLDPAADAPAGHVGEHIVAPYEDAAALARLARTCDVVTYEFESVPIDAARTLAKSVAVVPPPDALATAQDRLPEKRFFERIGVPTAAFSPVDSAVDLERAVEAHGLPLVLKTRRLGYDGKGQAVVRAREAASAAYAPLAGVPCIAEAFVTFRRELSIVAVRARGGETRSYPLVENRHEGGILRVTLAPAPRVGAEEQRAAEAIAAKVMGELDYVGAIAIELFETDAGLLANEMAPRVHNSGHWTIEGAETSQFENHVRAVLGLPLGATSAPRPCAMVNLIGKVPDRAALLAVEGAHVHLYGKEPAPGRKLGHVTVCAASEAERDERVARVAALVAHRA
jgi:5-(carboxyamino)imidazole ribonucleotide synthase